jgi:hypothetical protein
MDIVTGSIDNFIGGNFQVFKLLLFNAYSFQKTFVLRQRMMSPCLALALKQSFFVSF